MSFQWNKRVFYASFMSILETAAGRSEFNITESLQACSGSFRLDSCDRQDQFIREVTRRAAKNTFCPRRDAEGRGEHPLGLWLGLGAGVCTETGQGTTWLGEGMQWEGMKRAGRGYAVQHSMVRQFCNCLSPFGLRGELVRRCAGRACWR